MSETFGRRTIQEAIETIQRRWPQVFSRSQDAPIFILAAGWRSGSTLLQRMITPHCFVWGEPYGHAWLIDRLSDPIRAITDDWPEAHFIYGGQDAQARSSGFVANLYPPPEHLLQAHQQFFETLFKRPALAAGAERWGLKAVRLTSDHAAYLRWLFPQAKFLFLYRNPYDAYRSWAARRNAGWKWYNHWPDRPLTVREFGSHWRKLLSSFLEDHARLGGVLIKYEELAEGAYESIEEYLGLKLSAEAAKVRPADGPEPVPMIADDELAELDTEVKELAASLGYEYQPSSKPAQAAAVQSPANSRCVVLVPVSGHIEPSCEKGLQQLEQRGYTVRRVRGYAAIDQGRNQMVSDALADGFEETMWIDSDIDFNPDDVDRLRSHQLPLVCGIYPKKGRRELACHILPGTKKIVFGREGGLVEVLYAGTGFLHVRRETYLEIQQRLGLPACNQRWGRPVIPFFQPLVKPHFDGHWYLAEDFAFCARARQCGYQITADTTIRLRHIGSYGYTWEDAGTEAKRFGTYHFHFPDDS